MSQCQGYSLSMLSQSLKVMPLAAGVDAALAGRDALQVVGGDLLRRRSVGLVDRVALLAREAWTRIRRVIAGNPLGKPAA